MAVVMRLAVMIVSLAVAAAGCASGGVIMDGEGTGVDAQSQALTQDAMVAAPTPDAQALQPDATVAPPADAALPACTGGDGASLDPATGHCFIAYTTVTRSWIDARMACAAFGPRTQLATLNTQAETDRVNTLLGASEGWIGFDDSMAEGNFVWVTGEPTAYTFWAPGEPNDGGQNGEDCALTNRAGQAGRWDDRPCAMNYAFVCERVP